MLLQLTVSLMLLFTAGVHGTVVSLTNGVYCDSTVNVETSSNITVVAHEPGDVKTCTVYLKARGRSSRLCLGIDKLQISSNKINVEIFNVINSSPVLAKNYTSRNIPMLPSEWCSDACQVLFQISGMIPGKSEVDLKIQVRHMNQSRAVYLAAACGSTYPIVDGKVIVKSRGVDVGTLEDDCNAVFHYIGTAKKKLCATFVNHVSPCNYELKAYHGDSTTFLFSHNYECTKKPQFWCSKEKSLMLELIRNEKEPSNLFTVEIQSRDPDKDIIADGTTSRPSPDDDKPEIPWLIIVLITIGCLIAVTFVLLLVKFKSELQEICTKKKKVPTVTPKDEEEGPRADEPLNKSGNAEKSPEEMDLVEATKNKSEAV